ncbi:MAG: hypothetical protein ACXADF_14945 [Candidatus Thorarchaeota archaeon]
MTNDKTNGGQDDTQYSDDAIRLVQAKSPHDLLALLAAVETLGELQDEMVTTIGTELRSCFAYHIMQAVLEFFNQDQANHDALVKAAGIDKMIERMGLNG